MADLAARFDAKVSPEALTGCHLWTGVASSFGHGSINVGGRPRWAHRVAWELANKSQIPPGMCVLHTCDVPSCVNPAHLRLGTKRDNTRDMMVKGRDRFTGERNPVTKLTDLQVIEIRASCESGPKAAKRYGVSRATITAIRRMETRINPTEGEWK